MMRAESTGPGGGHVCPSSAKITFFSLIKSFFTLFLVNKMRHRAAYRDKAAPNFVPAPTLKKPSIPPRNPQKPQTSLKTFPPTPSHLIWDSPIHQDGHSKARFLLKSEQVIFISFPPRLRARSPFCIIPLPESCTTSNA